ncbi:hypothetical protein [Bacillus subtilis]|uniref:hypothetical protein n=1 Tax=Bacillus subtilis TaxID=1423 RepID=UPI0013E929E8|nr:hypothetical protein [Bacillus subtilis]MDV3522414.1 hypothetical protein [Bacillus subtilis subsp. subtilis]MEC0285943.1 hypothetical protein [Bacillus subtilis]MEC0293519.1 hypothetical protein [Bacillus subtilis]MEC0336558.1 hypothetical protein [Bacillus subtilis]MEC0392042.1 hypothetical protein [Bacillus subtilis]
MDYAEKEQRTDQISLWAALFFIDIHKLFAYWFVSLAQLEHKQHKITIVSGVKFQEGGVGFA